MLVAKLCPTLCNPVNCSPPGSSVHGILQVRILECVTIPFSRGTFPTQGSNLGLLNCKQILYHLSHQGSLTLDRGQHLIHQSVNRYFMESLCLLSSLTQRMDTLRVFNSSTKFCSEGYPQIRPPHTLLHFQASRASEPPGHSCSCTSSPSPKPRRPGLQTEYLTHPDKMLGSRALAGGRLHVTE